MSFFFFNLFFRVSLSCTHISPQLAFNLSNKNEKRKSEFTLLFVTLLFGAAAPLLRLSPESMNLFRRLNQKNRKCAATFSALYWKTSKKKKKTAQESLQHERVCCGSTSFFLFFPIELDEVHGKCWMLFKEYCETMASCPPFFSSVFSICINSFFFSARFTAKTTACAPSNPHKRHLSLSV